VELVQGPQMPEVTLQIGLGLVQLAFEVHPELVTQAPALQVFPAPH
jgi:hypothetical protein